jgi:peptidyl-tRNA hydrolase, PTH2 family
MTADSPLEPFLGVWSLDRDASDHGPVPLPRRGISTLLADGEGGLDLWLDDRVVDDAGTAHQAGFRVRVDGTPRILQPETPAESAALVARLEDGALVVEIRSAGEVSQRAVRRREGDVLVLEQELLLPDGRRVQTVGRYRPSRVKQVIAYRRDLKMRKGKIAAQVAHASLAAVVRGEHGPVDELRVALDGPTAHWLRHRSAKVVLSVEDEAALTAIHDLARRAGLPRALITDSGRTEFHGVPTRTAVAVGPATEEEVDAITGKNGAVATRLA